MNRLLVVVFALSLCASAQMFPFPGPGQKPAAAPPAGVSDAFTGTGALSASWTQALTTGGGYNNVGTCSVASGVVNVGTAYRTCAYLNNDASLGNDGQVQIDFLYTSTNDYGSLILRSSSTSFGNFYMIVPTSATRFTLYKVVNGANKAYINDFPSSSAMTAGAWYTLKIVYTGNSFTLSLGAQGGSLSTVGTLTDSTFSSGKPGFMVYENGTGTKTSAAVDNFSAQ